MISRHPTIDPRPTIRHGRVRYYRPKRWGRIAPTYRTGVGVGLVQMFTLPIAVACAVAVWYIVTGAPFP